MGWNGLRWVGLVALAVTGAAGCVFESKCVGGTTRDPDTGECSHPDADDGGGGSDGATDATSDGDAGVDAGTDAARDDDAGSEEAGPQITCEARCLRIPPSWEGPVLLREGTGETPACPDEAPVSVFEAGRGLTVPDLECECTCGDPLGDYSCGSVSVRANVNATCTGATELVTVADGECSGEFSTKNQAVDGDPLDWFAISTPELSGSGSCEPSLSTTRPDPSFGARARACDAPVAGGSCAEGSACVGGTDALCVYVEDDAECPAGFPSRTVLYRSFSDGRSCGECGCDSPEVECGGVVEFFSGCDFDGAFPPAKYAELDVGTCTQSDALYDESPVHALASFSVTGGCASSGGAVDGEVTPTEPITVCCEE